MSIISRSEREKLAKRKSILAAARDLFFEKGYQMTTMEEIAERADFSKRTIYIYFKNKDDLYISVTIEGFLIIEEQLIKIIGHESSLEKKLENLYFAVIEHSLNHPEYFRIFEYFFTDQARLSIPEELVETIYEHAWKCLGYLNDVIREGKERGIFRKDINPSNFSILLWRTSAGILDLAVMGKQSEEDRKNYMQLLKDNFDLLIRGAKSNGKSAMGKADKKGGTAKPKQVEKTKGSSKHK
jgi:AcrR family transcriptional regulator